jgi:hypothetical protein
MEHGRLVRANQHWPYGCARKWVLSSGRAPSRPRRRAQPRPQPSHVGPARAPAPAAGGGAPAAGGGAPPPAAAAGGGGGGTGEALDSEDSLPLVMGKLAARLAPDKGTPVAAHSQARRPAEAGAGAGAAAEPPPARGAGPTRFAAAASGGAPRGPAEAAAGPDIPCTVVLPAPAAALPATVVLTPVQTLSARPQQEQRAPSAAGSMAPPRPVAVASEQRPARQPLRQALGRWRANQRQAPLSAAAFCLAPPL